MAMSSQADKLTPAMDSDESLVQRMRGDDVAAGELLVKRYYPALMRYLQRLLGSDHLAEELHQQTWASVLENLDRFDAVAGGFKAWLFRIATNKANDHWRSAGREKAAKQGLRLVAEQTAPEAAFGLERTEQHQKLHRAIQSLPESQRQVLLLRYYGNFKFAQIARMLGCPLNTALGRMHKAILRLGQAMKD